MQVTNDFKLRDVSMVCPSCNTAFATTVLEDAPAITPETPMEADMRRPYPHAQARATTVAMCPTCHYCWWAVNFKPHSYNPRLIPRTPKIEYAKFFAHAIFSGRQRHCHPFDLALLALNGYWCSREEGQAEVRWLKLAAKDLEAALIGKDDHATNYAYYHYLLGEIYRQIRDFALAIAHFKQVTPISMVPMELVERQLKLAEAQNDQPAVLPKHLVREIFCPDTEFAKVSA